MRERRIRNSLQVLEEQEEYYHSVVASRFVANNPELMMEDDEVTLQEINENDLLEAREVVN